MGTELSVLYQAFALSMSVRKDGGSSSMEVKAKGRSSQSFGDAKHFESTVRGVCDAAGRESLPCEPLHHPSDVLTSSHWQ